MINSEKRKLLCDCYQTQILFHLKLKSFFSILAEVFLKFSDVKSMNPSILDIS